MFNLEPFSMENALPPAEVRFVDVHVEPWPDGRRIRVHLEITPFQQRPNLDVVIHDKTGEDIASTVIVEVMELKIVFTMHLRIPDVVGHYLLTAQLSYDEVGIVDRREVSFDIQEIPPETANQD